VPQSTGIVYLVGAGPGDPGLITRRGAELLERADVVAYDRLVHPDLLKLAWRARLVDVGKQPGDSARTQAGINELLIEEAKNGKRVVRLKGGDPFVFGRGGEEAEACAEAGVPFEVVPGVTSAVAGPAYAGIPLTHRAHASWVAIATGHEDPAKESSALDWDALARAPTAVFLMGVSRLGDITAKLLGAGRSPQEPAAVVASATWANQRVVRSTLSSIVADVEAAGVTPPAILVVGNVVGLSSTLDWLRARPLLGKRVFVTRTRAQAGALSAKLREAGAEPLEFPAIRVEEPDDPAALDAALTDLSSNAWCLFTSANGVESVWTRLLQSGRDARAFGGARVAAVGPATADALRVRGIVADLVPPEFNADALVAAIGSPSGDARGVLVVQPTGARPEIVSSLAERGWDARAAPAYRTVVDSSSVESGRAALDRGIGAVLFTSGSTVRSFVELWGVPPESALVCCIGPRTAEACADAGVHVDAVASEQTIDALVDALIAAYH
jgi:uroporphyrinogen III methyltransferase/synthase